MIAAVAPGPLEAQVRRGRQVDDGPGWTPITLGVRGGYDQNARGGGEVLGFQAHIPVISSGHVKLLPAIDFTFVNGGRENQYSVEAVFVTGGRQGGLYGGAGIGRRTTTVAFSATDPRTDASTYSFVAGVSSGFAGPVQTVVEFRWIYMRGLNVRPTPVTIGISLPLWRPPRPTS